MKKSVAILLALVLICSLAACGGDLPTEPPEANAAPVGDGAGGNAPASGGKRVASGTQNVVIWGEEWGAAVAKPW